MYIISILSTTYFILKKLFCVKFWMLMVTVRLLVVRWWIYFNQTRILKLQRCWKILNLWLQLWLIFMLNICVMGTLNKLVIINFLHNKGKAEPMVYDCMWHSIILTWLSNWAWPWFWLGKDISYLSSICSSPGTMQDISQISVVTDPVETPL